MTSDLRDSLATEASRALRRTVSTQPVATSRDAHAAHRCTGLHGLDPERGCSRPSQPCPARPVSHPPKARLTRCDVVFM